MILHHTVVFIGHYIFLQLFVKRKIIRIVTKKQNKTKNKQKTKTKQKNNLVTHLSTVTAVYIKADRLNFHQQSKPQYLPKGTHSGST